MIWYLVLLKTPAKVHQTPQKRMLLLMKKNMLICQNQYAAKSGWKHSSSHPLDNLISPLNSGIQTRSKTRNLVAFSAFISSIEPKNVKEALGDADWINSMQEELH